MLRLLLSNLVVSEFDDSEEFNKRNYRIKQGLIRELFGTRLKPAAKTGIPNSRNSDNFYFCVIHNLYRVFI
jgi:hypothetical protein